MNQQNELLLEILALIKNNAGYISICSKNNNLLASQIVALHRLMMISSSPLKIMLKLKEKLIIWNTMFVFN